MALDRALAAAVEGLSGGFTKEFGPSFRLGMEESRKTEHDINAESARLAQIALTAQLKALNDRAAETAKGELASAANASHEKIAGMRIAAPSAAQLKQQADRAKTLQEVEATLTPTKFVWFDPEKNRKVEIPPEFAPQWAQMRGVANDPVIARLISPQRIQPGRLFGYNVQTVAPEELAALRAQRVNTAPSAGAGAMVADDTEQNQDARALAAGYTPAQIAAAKAQRRLTRP